MIRNLAVAAIAALAFAAAASPAAARDRVYTAQLQTPVAEQTQVVANGGVWTCLGDSCRAAMQQPVSVLGCRQLARSVGALISYGPEGRPLNESRLAACNEAAREPATQQAQN